MTIVVITFSPVIERLRSMMSHRNRTLTGSALITVGLLFLLVSNDILLGWENVWPLFPVMGGVLFLRVFRAKRVPEMLFAGLSSVLLGLFLFLFAAGMIEWDSMAVAWPTIPLIAGISLLGSAIAGRREGASLLLGCAIVFFAVVMFLLESGTINQRVAAPVIRFWPLVLVAAGALVIRMQPREEETPDPDMEALREVLEKDAPVPPPTAPGTDEPIRLIADAVRAADGPSAATTVLVQALKSRFPRFAWVGVYRMAGGRLLLAETEYVGPRPDYFQIELNEGICGASASERRTIIVPDVCNDDRYLACSPTVKSEIVVPIFDGGVVVGVLDIDSDVLDAFSSDDQRFLEALVVEITPYIRVSAPA